jgi:hypothetical protein
MNRVWCRIVAAGLVPRRWPGKPVMGSTTPEVLGRKTGVMRRVPATWIEVGAYRHLVAMMGEESDWVRNVRANGGRVTLKRGGRRDAVLEELPVPERARSSRRGTGGPDQRHLATTSACRVTPRRRRSRRSRRGGPCFRVTPVDAFR